MIEQGRQLAVEIDLEDSPVKEKTLDEPVVSTRKLRKGKQVMKEGKIHISSTDVMDEGCLLNGK